MRTIDITTTQNVTIQYELGTLKERIIAYLLDMLILVSSTGILIAIFSGLFYDQMLLYVMYLVIFPLILFYTLLSEIFMQGQTLGKKSMNIKVISLSGKEPTLSDYLIRWAFRPVDIYLSAGMIASVLISSSDKSQRLGGILSNTTVIRLRPQMQMNLNDILNIVSREQYDVQYPAVRKFSEEDMFLIKSTLQRYKSYPNDAHREALYELVEQMKSHLGITEQIRNPSDFLRTILKDYIVLTR